MDWRDKPCFTIPEDAKLTDLSLSWQGRERARVPGRLNYFLREYQRDGVQFLWDRYCRDGGAILADDMGLGKTVQIIAFLSALYHKTGLHADNDENRLVSTGKNPCSPTLIICPGSVLSNWEEEIKTWGNFVTKKFYKTDRDTTLTLSKEGRCELVLTTFETGRDHVSVLNLVDWRLVIVDECHRIKEPTSAVTRALKSLECKRRIGLTGTALQNKYEELWCLLDWANPGCLGSCKHFQREFSVPMMLL
ncbi:DNA excision repair protein ERCC-6-like 2 [Eurytemora carolleeae]|uniref:DNA excision repair protein ERCC-6-like 2 n=1 Tax=Eurytemora carolleeae TaxID=1294199 RepID=UPI000C772684|nr:DNA excision repair protein ERCC-6-like 2 [Eurytemora carolleeae]|eukprot:XP_023325018.1 DNA excision repair protein ERCC-6-like 2 [Eurytemora affinis]